MSLLQMDQEVREATTVRPPGKPWRDLGPQKLSGFLTFYYSDNLSAIPVRAITRPEDNKADPNLETATYGLFSICGHTMRASTVLNHHSYLFFLTRRESGRVLTRYYRVRWFAPGTRDTKPPDFALAADELRFVHPGIPLKDLPGDVRAVASTRFRVCKAVNEFDSLILLDLLRQRPDRTEDYLSEIKRLETFSRYHTGYRYPSWKLPTSFTWDLAPLFLFHDVNTAEPHESRVARSPTNLWLCSICGLQTRSKALLRRCPECESMASLKPVANSKQGRP